MTRTGTYWFNTSADLQHWVAYPHDKLDAFVL